MKEKKIAIIGCGNMGGAIASALIDSNKYKIALFDKNTDSIKAIAKDRDVQILNSILDAECADIILIAVKPQVLPSLYKELSKLKPGCFISIAAGIPLKKLKENLNNNVPIVRFMPNIAAKTKNAVTAVAYCDSCTDDIKETAMDIATSFGSAFELEERLFSAFIGISGSAIAYVFEFMHQLAMGGVKEGIGYKESLAIVTDTLSSAISLQKESNKGAIELETMVCSAGGTTIEGIKALEDGAFGKAVINAVSAAANKSRELEKNS